MTDNYVQNIHVYLKSSEADSTSTNGATWILKSPLKFPIGARVQVLLTSLNCFHTFATVTSSNDTLSMSTGSYKIADGCYNSTSMTSQLNSLLNSANINASFNSSSLKFTLASNASSNFTIYGANSTCQSLIGFGSSGDYTSNSYSLTSSQIVNLSTPPAILLHTNLFVQSFDSTSKIEGTSVLATCPISVSYGGLIRYTPTLVLFADISIFEVQTIKVWFTSSRDGSDLNLQGQIFDLSICFQVTHPSENYVG